MLVSASGFCETSEPIILSSSGKLSCFWGMTGLKAVEFIANHAEISIAFVQEAKLPLVCT